MFGEPGRLYTDGRSHSWGFTLCENASLDFRCLQTVLGFPGNSQASDS